MSSKDEFQLIQGRKLDIEEIMDIECQSFKSPWSWQNILSEFDNAVSQFWLARHKPDQRVVVAYILFWIIYDELHILKVATHPNWRKQGLGERLVMHAITLGQEQAVRTVSLEVRRSNIAAICLYQKLGFKVIHVRPRYYENQEDAMIMELVLL